MKSPNELNFLSVVLSSPAIKLGDINYNAKLILSEIAKHSETTNLFVFPELCLTGATLDNYFLLSSFTNAINDAVFDILVCSYSFHTSIVLGTPLWINDRLMNCALFISDGKLIGIVPRQTNSSFFQSPKVNSFTFNGYEVPISTDLVFNSRYKLGLIVGKPSISQLNRLSDADIIAIIDATPYDFNRTIAADINVFSKYTDQAMLYVNASECESSADNIYHGETVASMCGHLLYGKNKQEYINEIDVHTLKFSNKSLKVALDFDIISGTKKQHQSSDITTNNLTRFDFIKKDFSAIECYKSDNTSIYSDPFRTKEIQHNIDLANEILDMQALGLARRIKDINISSLVLGISGGIDSTLALLVAIKAFEMLNFDKQNIHAISMPGLATSGLTVDITHKLCTALGVNYSTISITDAVIQHFKDIGHNPNETNIVYENSQARMRTMVLFDYANKVGGLVVGTGDMSEIALGWNTFNGDHISNYNVNCGIPKTVAIAMLIAFIDGGNYPKVAKEQFEQILSRPISPELVPQNTNNEMQSTEQILGPYELHDFFLYYFLKYYLSKEKIVYLASVAFEATYSVLEIEKTFDVFWNRFVKNQYKRNCSADGPDIFGISLSPRNGAIFPSDIGLINN